MAGDNFNKILNGIYLDFEYVQSNDGNLEIRKWKKRKLVHTNVNNTNKQSLPFVHGHNGMLTLAFSVCMHYDKGDGNVGYTVCSNLAADTTQNLCLLIIVLW